MSRSMILVFTFLLGLILALQGCGGGGGSPDVTTTTAKPTTTTITITSTTTFHTTTTTTTLTTTTLACQGQTVPDSRDGKVVADQMNSEYNGYQPGNKNSPVGVFIRATHSTDIFCDKGCYLGDPDCRVSGSILNYKQMINPTNGHAGGFYGSATVGFYVNGTLVKTKLGKCTYAWDGATMNKVNFGCGCAQGQNGNQAFCDPTNPAFNATSYNNKVPPDYKETSGAESSNVKPCSCTDGFHGKLPENGLGSQCFWKGVAFDTKTGDSEDETHDMLARRIENSHQTIGSQCSSKGLDSVLCWNEMVIDGERMLQAMGTDPAGTISAIVYADGSKGEAQRIANDMLKLYPCMKKPVPVIKLRQDVDARSGKAEVFVFEGSVVV